MKALALVLLAAAPSLALGEPITLKGLGPGMTKAQVNQTHDSLASNCMRPERDSATDEVCGYSTKYHSGIPALHTLADVKVQTWTLMLKDGVVHTVAVSFAADDFDRVEGALIERWGKPVERKIGEVKNRMGASFDQVQATWNREGSLLRAAKRGGKVDESRIYLTTARGIQERDQARKESAKAGAQDM